jgi:hypothetical protein
MTLKQIIPWRWGGLKSWEDEDRPFESFFHGMDSFKDQVLTRLSATKEHDQKMSVETAPAWSLEIALLAGGVG